MLSDFNKKEESDDIGPSTENFFDDWFLKSNK